MSGFDSLAGGEAIWISFDPFCLVIRGLVSFDLFSQVIRHLVSFDVMQGRGAIVQTRCAGSAPCAPN